ncbi:chemotaxis protein methyltransferase CheR [Syntrophus gentianae]|uniref:protein-glutamate O-methyltransferase n=1 Tax=Syntrophus gentianae TaxID=43775 RepID=A0A1H7X0N1_9BACT|nr:protein-glutamate O-methyltransferase [Syntrophus gentianae]SEM26679.1 chemotaxis protein methyltransferase CheR [Syntrophus gentianae]
MNSSELSDREFEKISQLVYSQCGINLHDGKKELVKARLGKRLREGNFRSFSDYYKYVTTREGTDELITMIDSISTNLTYFFREESHFQRLQTIVKSILDNADKQRQKIPAIRIWSAGCSTGEEPYSLGITIKESLNGFPANVKIMATDISTRVLKIAGNGVYPVEKTKNITSAILRKYFQQGHGNWDGYIRIKKEISDMIDFSRFNLMETPSSNHEFDIIFCRNVMIYFDKQTQGSVVNKFYNCLGKGGYLFIGHSESLTGLDHAFKYIEPSVYRK